MPFSLSVVWLCLVIKSCSLRLRRVGGLGVGVACVSTHHTMLRRFALFPELFGSSAESFFIADFKFDYFTCKTSFYVYGWWTDSAYPHNNSSVRYGDKAKGVDGFGFNSRHGHLFSNMSNPSVVPTKPFAQFVLTLHLIPRFGMSGVIILVLSPFASFLLPQHICFPFQASYFI